MSPVAFALILLAAFIHAAWNFIVKKIEDRQLVSWWAILFGAAVSLPLLLPHVEIPRQIWPHILSSALAETTYYFALMRAYANADFSLTYPIARGVAPALITVWAMIFVGERLQLAGMLGLGVILLGLMVIGVGHRARPDNAAPVQLQSILWALLIAFLISVYSVIDAAAVRAVSPLPYLMIVLGCAGLFMTPFILGRYGWRAALVSWRKNFFSIVFVALFMPLAYVLVLQAYALAPIGYVGALREISIVLAALAGWRWLGEAFGKVRVAGAILIFLGILVITFAG